MLTNGWRRINWNDVVNNKYPEIKYQNDTDYLSLSGKVYGASEQDLKKGAIYINDNRIKKIQQIMLNKLWLINQEIFPTRILFYTIHQKFITKFPAHEDFANSSVVNFNNSLPAAKFYIQIQ